MKKRYAAIPLILSASMLASVPAFAEDGVTVSWYNFGDAFSSYVRDSMSNAFDELGVDATMKDSNNIQQTQNDDLQTAVNTGTSAIVVQMVDSGAYATAKNILQMGMDADIPVIFFSRVMSTDNDECAELMSTYDKTCYIGTKPEEAGYLQGDMIGEYLVNHYDECDLNGDGKISYVMLKGDQANQEAIYRTKYSVEYANKALEKAGYPDLEYYDPSTDTNGDEGPYIVDPNGSWSQTFANETMTTILTQYNESNNNMPELIISNNDDMAIGAINALKVAGYNTEGGTYIPVFGVDATDQAKKAIAAGEMTGSVLQDPEIYGKTVARVTANSISGKDMFDGLDDKIQIIDGWDCVIPYAPYTADAETATEGATE
jgi:methyl-galactoside transport system substrate-binding protein